MRLNGTYLDRLWICVLPYTIIGTIVAHFAKDLSLEFDLILLAGFTLFLWSIDSLRIYRRRLKPLSIDQVIYLDGSQISPKDILEITSITSRMGRWEIDIIQFSVQKNKLAETISVLAKPMSLLDDIMGKDSKTLGPLFSSFPELKEKLKP